MTTPAELDRLLDRSLERMLTFHRRGPRPIAAEEAGILMSRLVERYPQALAKLGQRLAGPLHTYHGLCYKCGAVPPDGPENALCALCRAEEDQSLKDHGFDPEAA